MGGRAASPADGGRLGGRVALVTGASSGIGRAIAQEFAKEGALLHLVDIDVGRLRRVAARTGGTWTGCDLADASRVAECVGAAVASHGRLDVLVNCAAVVDGPVRAPATKTSLELWNHVFAVNVTAPFLLSVAAVTAFRARRGGSIINVASIGGIGAFPNYCAYVASKAALIGLTKSMALDYGSEGIRVNAIAPGAIDTPQVKRNVTDRRTYLKTIAASAPLHRIGRPDEVAALAIFLASDESSYVTAEVIVVDGGRLAKA